MIRELRKHPRVPTNLSCTVHPTEDGTTIDATTFSIAARGLAVMLDPEGATIENIDSDVKVSMVLGGDSVDVVGRIVWAQPNRSQRLRLGIQLYRNRMVRPHAYERWVAKRYEALRQDSLALGGDLAIRRKITLRSLQEALDAQARDGGYLRDHLERLPED